MNILIVGCGKVGSQLANSLWADGHTISVVDRNKERFAQLDDEFSGFTVTGVPIDTDVLKKAGIEACDVLAAVTEDDNTNMMVSQMGREFFNVPKVLARIYDPRRKNVFSQFGLHTFCPTSITVDAIRAIIDENVDQVNQVDFQNCTLSLTSCRIDPRYEGGPVGKVPVGDGYAAVGLLHKDGTLTLLGQNDKIQVQEGDHLLRGSVLD